MVSHYNFAYEECHSEICSLIIFSVDINIHDSATFFLLENLQKCREREMMFHLNGLFRPFNFLYRTVSGQIWSQKDTFIFIHLYRKRQHWSDQMMTSSFIPSNYLYYFSIYINIILCEVDLMVLHTIDVHLQLNILLPYEFENYENKILYVNL